ncbi:MAG TPA: CvpA family protein [Burkholderiaceae bacterium]|nr:CvpA family protein [Burkholderiaceae bacterium]
MTIDLGWVDIGLAVFLLLSVLIGAARGFVFELLSLAGWFAAWFAGWWLTPTFAGHIRIGAPGSSLNYGVTFACVFLVALVVWSLGARLVRALVRATPLSAVDRLLGAGFGFVRGLVVLLVAATVIGISPWGHSIAWQRSQGVAWLNTVLHELRPLFINDTPPQNPTA